jgi:hypothetical protein
MILILKFKLLRQRALIPALSVFFTACSITAVRPSQEMSNMEVAIRAAKEVGADNLAPELYRNAIEQGLMARKEYRFKNFMNAKALAEKARILAEKAEFESLRNGGKREALPVDPLSEPSYAPEPISTPAPIDPAFEKPAGMTPTK